MEYYVVCCNYKYKNKNAHAGGPCSMLSLRCRDTVFDYSCVDGVPPYLTVIKLRP
jgi:hypothetical protein